ncbi:retinitis pigmentosa 1-like 1 protein, partial [Onychostoma macrolepis]|uniref:retinitis pigmentosa 1-like 1 protein n=1 Tax=Onychostoma macrolepis TaxID=369639 RepID=UPI00272D38D2
HHHHHHHHRHSRKIVLVKNSDPSVRRTIVLHRRSLRSLALFMDEVSELMQCLIRKLYTLEGHKIDSVQSLLQCPSILVCVGREPFHPLLLDSFRKNSYDKLPRLNTKQRSSVCSDEKGAKKNVNFGLETKRSVIHPRCDSSNRSARLSVSSEKLFPNGLNPLPPGHRGPHPGENTMDDDIEKRVLVNKDGSLSMEMKVRFRLLHNETLHWSTEVKKSKSTFNESHVVPDDACSLSHGSAESCSEADSLSAGEADETYSTKRYQRHFEEPHCQHCCAHCQEYDIWKNPVPPDQGSARHIRSSSSSASSRKIVCKKASTDSMRTMSSEEYTEHVVEKATCIQRTFGQQGDSTVEQCTINHCHSRSEVRSMSPKTKSTSAITQPVEEEERSVSVVSCSSQILASLKEDQDDEDVDLPLSTSRTSRGQQDEESLDAEPNPCSTTPCKSPAHLSPRPPSKSSSLGRSKRSRKLVSQEVSDEEGRSEASAECTGASSETIEERSSSAISIKSNISGKSNKTNVSEVLEKDGRAPSAMSVKSQKSDKSRKTDISDNLSEEQISEVRTSSAMSVKSNISVRSKISDIDFVEALQDNVEERAVSAVSSKSNISATSSQSKEPKSVPDGALDETIEERASSIKSGASNKSGIEEVTNDDQTVERAPSSISRKSNISARSNLSIELSELEDQDRAPSSISVKSNVSHKSKSDISEAAYFQGDESLNSVKLNTPEAGAAPQTELSGQRSPSSLPSKSNISTRSRRSKNVEVDQDEAQEKDDVQERASSAISIKSTTSARSRKSETTPKSGEEMKERAPSVMSVKSNASLKSNKSKMEEEEIENRASSALSVKSEVSTLSKKSNQSDVEQMEKRPSSAISAKSNVSVRSKRSKMSEVAGDDDRSSAAALHISETSNECSTAPEETCKGTEKSTGKEKRATSALSTRSNNSAISKKSKISDMADDIGAEDRDDLRSASAMSSKSNVSVKSAVSELVTEEPLEAHDQTEERAQSALSAQSNQSGVTVSEGVEVAEERALSAMSSKSNASERPKKSNNLKVPTALPQAAEHQTEERAQSALSARSSVSTRSNKSKISDVLTDVLVDVRDQEEERASSVLSAKSSISAKSKKSNASATDVKADDKEKGDRVPSAMSGRSDISTKTSISAKSKASKVSEVPPEEPDDEESEIKAPSITKSSISVRSNKSKHSEKEVQNIERPTSAISVISDATHDENEITDDGEIQERAPSAASAKSHSSVRSRTSKVSEIIIDEPDKQKVERAPSSSSLKSDASGRSGADDPVNEEKEARTESALSSISVRSKKSEDSEIISYVEQRASSAASVTSKTSARSKRSNISVVAPIEIGNTDTGDVRASSAMSAKSCVSAKSKCSERTTEDEEASKVVDRTTSSLSVKSNPSITSATTVKSSVVPTKSNASAKSLLSEAEEPDSRSTSVASNASAETKMSKASVNTQANRSPSKLSVKSNLSTRSKKSKVSESEDHTHTNTEDTELNRDKSPLSDHSKVSQTKNSNECICGAINKPSSPVASSEEDSDHEEIPASPLSKKSAKSKISSVGSTSERVLTPTSTSVSIGIVEDHEADDVEEIDGGAVSINSRISASSKTEICGISDQCLSKSPVQITNEATPTSEERPKSSTSAKSNVSGKSKSKSSHCGSTCPTDTIQDRDDVASNKSSKIKYLMPSSENQPSPNSSVRQSSQTQEIRPSSKASDMSVHTEITGQEKAESPDVTHKSQSVCSKCSSTQQKGKISDASCASAISDSEKSKTKEGNTAEMADRPKSNISSSSSRLKINSQKNDVEATVVSERSNKLNTKSTQKVQDNAPERYSATLSVTSGNHLSPKPPKSPKKSKKPIILLGNSNDSKLSQTVPALEPRKEYTFAAAGKPESCRSDTNVSEIKSEKSSKCRKRIGSDSSCHKMDDDISELSPSCLPNASPTEVVNEWLRKIPSLTTLCDLGDGFHDDYDSIEPLCTSHVPSGDDNEHGCLQPSDVTKLVTQNEMEDDHVVNTEGATDKESPEVAEGDRSQRGDEPKKFDSSVLVMKVLLSPKLDRCNSLPEVSPVYGRKLSASAQGLLDCLANLQLLDFGPSDEDGKKEKYQELMSMLKSLWLCDPKDGGKTSVERNKRLDEEFKARSSSGVDVNSGSTGSGKSSVNDGTQPQINTECEVLETLTKVQEVDETAEGEASDSPESKYDSVTPDIANQAQLTPETKDTVQEKLKDDVPGSEETIRSNDSPRELIETPLSSNKSSVNNPKKEETESDRQEDASSGSAPKQQRGQLSKRLSQDPDPVWVLNLLNKLEKQFMTHYVNAMAEFKVRWNLDDNEQLDAMICELQGEVRRRIQSSIDRELRKIQGRAGRPRPPKDTMSRESTMQTEQRRRRLKVMRNQSVDPQPDKSDDDYTMTGTDFSDQRSDDEYCPCDTCLKKKMASKHVLPVEMLNSAPVMIDFDLRRILQMKKSSPNNEKIEETANEQASEMKGENAGLAAVKEEDEKEGADKEILASSAIEDEKQECEEGEEEDSASSSYVEYSSEKQSNIPRHLKKDMDEIAEKSVNTMTAQQDEDQEETETDSDLMALKESTSSCKINELDEDVTNDDISEFDDIMQTEAAEEAFEEHTEEESEQQDKTADDETAEEGQNAGTESVEEGETTGEETSEDGQTPEEVAAGENGIAGCDTAEEGETAEAKTSRHGETAGDETAEEGEMSEDKTSEDGQTAEAETTSENGQTSEDVTAEECATVNDDNAKEHEMAEKEALEDGQTAEDETGEECETVNDENGEEHETTENESVEDGQIAEDETGEEGETVNDDTAEEQETTENEMAEDGQTAEGETGEEGETVNDDTAEEHETDECETAEEGRTAEDETGEEGETVNDDTAEEQETTENEMAEDGQTAEGEIEEEGETVNEDTAEEHETDECETAEEGRTAEDETRGKDETVHEDTAEEHETVENETVEECQTAEDDTGEEGETINNDTTEEHETAENETSEDGETDEDKTAEEGETTEDKTSEDGRTAEAETVGEDEITEDETAGEGEASAKNESVEEEENAEAETESNTGDDETAEKSETADNNSEEEHETAENESVEDGQAETARESDSGEEDTAKESVTAEDEMAENGQTAEAREGETDSDEPAEDEQNAEADAGEGDTADNEAVDDEQTAEAETAYESETAEDETEAERDTVDGTSVEERGTDVQRADEDEDNTDDAGTTGGVSAEEKEASESETADERTTEAETEMSEEKATVEDSNTAEDQCAVVELAEQTPDHETTGEETDKSQSNDEEDKETVSCEAAEEEDVLSNIEDTESHNVLTYLEVIEDETLLKNNGDIVLDSVDDKGEESGKEDDDVEVLANKAGYVANTGESAEAGDEAEDDTETDEGEHNRNTLTLQPLLQPKPKDDKPDGATSFNVLGKHNSEFEDGADADVEDSETEEHNQVIDLTSESESKPQSKTAHKTFKMLIHTMNFLKLSATGLPKSREEDNEPEVEDEETPEDGSDDAEESSCVEKDEVEENGKEKGKLTDITEDTAEGEEDQTNETSDDSEDHEWESSENSLQKQITKSSLESQPGSFEEVHEEQEKNQKGLNNLKASW